MALLDPPRSETPSTTAIVAALVVVHTGPSLPEALEAVGRQVYEPESVVVIGGGSRAQDFAIGHTWMETLADALDGLDSSITHVWMLHDDSIPRPDALEALVRESDRSNAEVVGSKILRAEPRYPPNRGREGRCARRRAWNGVTRPVRRCGAGSSRYQNQE